MYLDIYWPWIFSQRTEINTLQKITFRKWVIGIAIIFHLEINLTKGYVFNM